MSTYSHLALPLARNTTLTMLLIAFAGISFGQTPVTFVNGSLFNGGSILSGYSPIPVQELAVGDFNGD